jgi:Formin Homology 2 Domain
MKRIGEAFDKYKNDEVLKNFMVITLAVGNFMNGKTKRGDSYGFRLTEIDKIFDIRSSHDSNKTLIGYIVRLLEK